MTHILSANMVYVLIPVAARTKARFCSRSLIEIAGSNPTGGHGLLSVVSVVCSQVDVSASG